MLTLPNAFLLGLIGESPKGPYEITKLIKAKTMRNWYYLCDSTVYGTIKKLSKMGFIEGTPERYTLMPERTVYNITEAGKVELRNSLAEYAQNFDFDTTYMSIAVRFFDVFDKEAKVDVLEKRIRNISDYIDQISPSVAQTMAEKADQVEVDGILRRIDIANAEMVSAKRLLATVKSNA